MFLLFVLGIALAQGDVFENRLSTVLPYVGDGLGAGVYHRVLEEIVKIDESWWGGPTGDEDDSSDDKILLAAEPRELLFEGPGREICRRAGIAAYERLCTAKCTRGAAASMTAPIAATTLPICVDTCRVTALEMCEAQKCREHGCVVSLAQCRRIASEFC